jgi:ribosomal protein L40E
MIPKTCPHCNALNPYTNTSCDRCAHPLNLEEYKKEMEKRRNVDRLYENLKKIYTGKLSEGQKAQLSGHTETIKYLTELGRDDLTTQYIEKLLETWVKVFLTR